MENKVKMISNELVNDGQYNKKYKLSIIKKSKTVAVKDLIKLPKPKKTHIITTIIMSKYYKF